MGHTTALDPFDDHVSEQNVKSLTLPEPVQTSDGEARGSKTPPEKVLAILALYDLGITTARDIASRVNADWRTVHGVLARHRDKATDARALLTDYVLDAAADWRTASAKAAKSGNHQPAKDLLLLTRVIDPLPPPTSTLQVGVQVVLGIPDQPCAYVPHQPPQADNSVSFAQHNQALNSSEPTK